MEVLNLKKIKQEDKVVELESGSFIIPGELSVLRSLELIDVQNRMQKDINNIEVWKEALQMLYRIFKIRQENLIFEDFTENITMEDFSKIIVFIFGGLEEAEKKSTDDQSEEQKKK